MADRFPSLEDFYEGTQLCFSCIGVGLIYHLGQTEPVSNGASGADGGGDEDFLTRERAALGEDAAIFANPGDNTATVQDGDDDLLGGGDYNEGQAGGQEITEFESSFPAVDTSNDVSYDGTSFQ